MKQPELMTAKEVAEALRVTPTTLSIWRRTAPNDLKFVRLGGRAIRYRRIDVEAFIEGRLSRAS